ncbi:MAG: hypothetical protein WC043_10245 [Pseudobdellovibrionaceae bacterium]
MSAILPPSLTTHEGLSRLPFYKGLSRIDVAHRDAPQFHALLHKLRWITPAFVLRLGDKFGAKTLARTNSPYEAEVAEMALRLGDGVYTLNTGFEWGCTAYARHDHEDQPVLHRVLDWALPMGAYMHVAQYDTRFGDYFDINWAGNAGMINGVAPGRFVISINQAPVPMHTEMGALGWPVDWAIQRYKTLTSEAWLPAHLLRHVFENAGDYTEACAILTDTPLSIPVIFTICGTQKGEVRVIERRENDAHVLHEGSSCTANHWQSSSWLGHPRPIKSRDRLAAARKTIQGTFGGHDSWNWLAPPMLNSHSIMAFSANTEGLLNVVALVHTKEGSKPVAAFSLNETRA